MSDIGPDPGFKGVLAQSKRIIHVMDNHRSLHNRLHALRKTRFVRNDLPRGMDAGAALRSS
jgi:hypothetical protein